MFTHCKVCGKHLRSEKSRELWVGPVCWLRETLTYWKHGKPSDNQMTIFDFIKEEKWRFEPLKTL